MEFFDLLAAKISSIELWLIEKKQHKKFLFNFEAISDFSSRLKSERGIVLRSDVSVSLSSD